MNLRSLLSVVLLAAGCNSAFAAQTVQLKTADLNPQAKTSPSTNGAMAASAQSTVIARLLEAHRGVESAGTDTI